MKNSALIFIIAPLFVCCGQKKKEEPPPPKSRVTAQASHESMLRHYDLSGTEASTKKLPGRLSEASGLAISKDGKLFSHDDEQATVYQVDLSSGKILKQFSLGRFGIKGDFEDIAIAGNLMYLVRSDGVIYEFPEGDDGRTVEYRTYKTPLTASHDVEGMCYDPETDALLLACKEFPGKGYEEYRAVYSFSLKSKSLNPKPRFLISLREVTKKSDKKEFRPSGIERHPVSGSFFIIAAHGSSVIELSKDGTLLGQQSINKKVNSHPEGITFAPDMTLILCNDGQGAKGTLTLYPAAK